MNVRYIHVTKNGEGVDINIGDDDGSKPASKASVKIKIEVFYHLISLTVSQHLFLMAFPQRHLVCFTKYAMPSFCHRHRWRPTFASLPHYYPTPPQPPFSDALGSLGFKTFSSFTFKSFTFKNFLRSLVPAPVSEVSPVNLVSPVSPVFKTCSKPFNNF